MNIDAFEASRRSFSFLSDSTSKSAISDKAFVAALSVVTDGEPGTGNLEALRRSVAGLTGTNVSRQSFHERMGTQKLKKNLLHVLDHQIDISQKRESHHKIAETLGVRSILLQDASTLALPNDARFIFPGVNTDKSAAAIKVHVTLDLLKQGLYDYDVSSGTENDSNYFVSSSDLAGKLIIFDLGYYSFDRFRKIEQNGGYFLSRVKTNACAVVTGVRDNSDDHNLGKKLNETTWEGDTVDFTCTFGSGDDCFTTRVVGFWNEEEEKYHFYLTNLTVPAKAIWPLYRCRWQIELAFKSMKQSLLPERVSTSNPRIIVNLILIFLIRFTLSGDLLAVMKQFDEDKRNYSLQKAAKVINHLTNELFTFIFSATKQAARKLRKKVCLYRKDFIRRSNKLTSLEKLEEALM